MEIRFIVLHFSLITLLPCMLYAMETATVMKEVASKAQTTERSLSEEEVGILQQEVIGAAGSGDIDTLRRLIAKNKDLAHARDPEHNATALHWVVGRCPASKRMVCARFLVEETDLDINALNNKQTSALRLALTGTDSEIVRYLLTRKKIKIVMDNDFFWGPTLIRHINKLDVEERKKLETYSLDQELIDTVRFNPSNIGHIRSLISRGANVCAFDTENVVWTAFLYAAQGGEEAVVKELILAGADVTDFLEYGGGYSRRTKLPKCLAEENGHEGLAMLLQNYFDLLKYCSVLNPQGITKLRELLSKGLFIDARGSRGRTTLLNQAEYCESFDAVKLLVDSGADVNALDSDGLSALYLAVANNKYVRLEKKHEEEIAVYLISKGGDVSKAQKMAEDGVIAKNGLSRGKLEGEELERFQAKLSDYQKKAELMRASEGKSAEEKQCLSCKQTKTEGLKRCGRCKKVYFCDETCQKKSWPEHKANCNNK